MPLIPPSIRGFFINSIGVLFFSRTYKTSLFFFFLYYADTGNIHPHTVTKRCLTELRFIFYKLIFSLNNTAYTVCISVTPMHDGISSLRRSVLCCGCMLIWLIYIYIIVFKEHLVVGVNDGSKCFVLYVFLLNVQF